MIDERKNLAIQLRSSGYSIKSIATKLGAAQSSISLWVRNVQLTNEQIYILKMNTHLPEVVEKRRQSRLKKELAKRNELIEKSESEIQQISQRELWLVGTCLYWAEGSKKSGAVQFSNGDPQMIVLILQYFRKICGAEEQKLRARIHIHEHLDSKAAEKYWQKITKIHPEKFYKTYNKPNKSSKGIRNSLPYGVCEIYVLDTRLLLKIKGWTIGICKASSQLL